MECIELAGTGITGPGSCPAMSIKTMDLHHRLSRTGDQIMDVDAACVEHARFGSAGLPKKDQPCEDKVFHRTSHRPAKS